MSVRDSHVLGVFAKAPIPGQVKTRLAERWDSETAARVAEAFLRDTLDRLGGIPARRVLAYAPRQAEAYFAAIAGTGYELYPQAEGDLGERMSDFFAVQFRQRAETVIIVGTDSPTLPLGFVKTAQEQLQTADLVLGPATDGGYYLIGARPPAPPVFRNVPWGTSQVLAATVERVAQSGCRLALLPPWYDVDTVDDWRMLRGHLAALRQAGQDPGVPHTELLGSNPRGH